ncbi:MAG: thiol-disulfide oxidoreductase DCC family protein [Cyclobacteriaceae bacterium]|nr:thiol-disulfide oxidoreductase DCC family protein [Cyclobacteriaceae bacterium]
MKKTILFDGVCNLCNGATNFIINRDKEEIFHFVPLQSEKGAFLLKKYMLPPYELNTIILLDNDKAYIKSTAILKIVRHLSGAWPFLFGLMIIPRFIRDNCYDIIAKNRYKWFGKSKACKIPSSVYKK